MAKYFINPKTIEFDKLEPSEEEESWNLVDAKEYVKKLQRQNVILYEALESISQTPEEGFPANLLKLEASQALDKYDEING
jgi:hypothetical protein